MKKTIYLLGIGLLVLAAILIVAPAVASDEAQIAVTATGSEAAISLGSNTTFACGTLVADEVAQSGLAYFDVTNDGSESVDITIHGHDMTGGAVTWTLADDGNNGDGIIGMYAGLDGDAYNIIVKKSAAYNTLKAGLASSATQKFGLQLEAPSATVGNEAMTMASSGVILTATLS